jgi:hypothetical protein
VEKNRKCFAFLKQAPRPCYDFHNDFFQPDLRRVSIELHIQKCMLQHRKIREELHTWGRHCGGLPTCMYTSLRIPFPAVRFLDCDLTPRAVRDLSHHEVATWRYKYPFAQLVATVSLSLDPSVSLSLCLSVCRSARISGQPLVQAKYADAGRQVSPGPPRLPLWLLSRVLFQLCLFFQRMS